MNDILLYENEEQMSATEKVLAAFKIKSINEEIDAYVAEILKYAVKMDDILAANSLDKRYLNLVSTIDGENDSVLTISEDIKALDFRVVEQIEDLIKRVNTRINIIKDKTATLNQIYATYDLKDIDLEEEVKTAKLTKEELVD